MVDTLSATPAAAPPPGAAAARRMALRSAGPIALGGLFANGVNILVTLVLARLLSLRDYGALNQLIAIFFVLSIPGSALLVGVVRRATAWQQSGQTARLRAWATRTRQRAYLLVTAWAVLVILIRGPLAGELSLPGPSGLAEILVAGAMWGVLCLDRGLLQARHAYRAQGVNLLIEGVSRLLSLALVALGRGVGGAALGILCGVVLSEAHARYALHRHGWPDETDASPVTLSVREQRRERHRLAVDLLVALGALALLGVLQNFDVVILGREAPGNAGIYAPISQACKPLALAAFVLAGFLLPETASRKSAGGHALHQLAVTLGVLAVPAIVLLGISLAGPRQFLEVTFGPRLTGAANAFALLALAMTLLAAAVLFTHYLLAAGQPWVLAVLAVGAGLTVGLLMTAHGNPWATARADLVGQASVAAVTGLMVLSNAGMRWLRLARSDR